MGVAGLTPGEADLALGPEELARVLGEGGFPILAANLLDGSGRAPFQGFTMLEVGGTKVGIVGLVGRNMRGVGQGKLQVVDPAASLDLALAALDAAGAQLEVLLAHMDAAEIDRTLAAIHHRVDVVLQGHMRGRIPKPREVSGAVVVASGYQGKEVGKLVLHLVPGAKGIRSAGGADVLKKELERIERRLSGYRKSLERLAESKRGKPATRERRRLYYEGQIEQLEKRKTELEGRIASFDQGNEGRWNTYSFESIRLDDRYRADPEIEKLVAQAKEEQSKVELTPRPGRAKASGVSREVLQPGKKFPMSPWAKPGEPPAPTSRAPGSPPAGTPAEPKGAPAR